MKRFLIITCLFSIVGCQYIDSGNVGVRVNLSGTNKGIDPKPIGVGRCFYNPFTESIHEFPVYEQNIVWSKTSERGDESFTISSSQSAQISVDVGLTFTLHEDKVPHLFSLLRKDIDYIAHDWMRNHVRNALSKSAEEFDTFSILGGKKSELLENAKNILNEELAEYGIEVKLLSFVNSPRPDERNQNSIDLAFQAEQAAKQAENKVAESKAIAEQAIEKAKGKAKEIEMEAQAKLLAAKSEAEANRLISESLTPELVKLRMIERWDGVLPKFGGGEFVPLVDVSKEK